MQIKLDTLIYSTLYKELGDSCILRDMLYSIYCFICADVKPTGVPFSFNRCFHPKLRIEFKAANVTCVKIEILHPICSREQNHHFLGKPLISSGLGLRVQSQHKGEKSSSHIFYSLWIWSCNFWLIEFGLKSDFCELCFINGTLLTIKNALFLPADFCLNYPRYLIIWFIEENIFIAHLGIYSLNVFPS